MLRGYIPVPVFNIQINHWSKHQYIINAKKTNLKTLPQKSILI